MALGRDFTSVSKAVTASIPDHQYFRYQLALPIFSQKHQLNCIVLDSLYNFINDSVYEDLYPEQIEQIKILHYLRTGNFDREYIFASPHAYRNFIQKNLTGVDQIFQAHVQKLWDGCPPHLALQE
jgi:hypothetical protein